MKEEREERGESEKTKCDIDEKLLGLRVVFEETIVFDRDISPQSVPFHPSSSSSSSSSSSPSPSIPFLRNGDEVTSSVFIWIAAIDLLLLRLKDKGVTQSDVKSIGVTAQQHGSVWWRKGGNTSLFCPLVLFFYSHSSSIFFILFFLSFSFSLGSQQLLDSANSQLPLQVILQDAFSVVDCPIWMDGSTKVLHRDIRGE